MSCPSASQELSRTRSIDPKLTALLSKLDRDLELEASGEAPWTGLRMSGVPASVMHGNLGDLNWVSPRLVVECDEDARPGYTSKKAHEYQEEPSVLCAKIALLAAMLLQAKHPCAYTGAGISTASGIADYASKATNSVALKRKAVSGFEAQPTLAHRVLVALHRGGMLEHWVQQNHDGLPQKAGFPPEHLNEIHGAWYDPSNPVVPMTGSLRSDLCAWLEEWEEKTDLCLALGTSLCGMNADRMVDTVSQKAKATCKTRKINEAPIFGSVIVGLQQTQYDSVSSLRFYCTVDAFAALLARELHLHIPPQCEYSPSIPRELALGGARDNRFISGVLAPYDPNGHLLSPEKREDPAKQHYSIWDLSIGNHVKVTAGPGKGYVGKILARTPEGHIQIRLPCQREGSKDQGKKWATYILGSWWLESAAKGSTPRLPVVGTKETPRLLN